MAKGHAAHQARLGQLSLLGKPLARRSGRSCELCSASGTELQPYEVPPVPAEPELERTLFLCAECRRQIDDPKKMEPARWRPLESAVWSVEPAVQVMAIRLLRRLQADTAWAREALDAVDLEPEIEAWADAAS